MKAIHWAVGTWIDAKYRPRDERGLSQSTENAILLAGAVSVALAIILFITDYVRDRMPTATVP
ncbi:hypothetical protein [Tessaracoccus caeni]|uniref:hypothetical protein n=1 Tax=Tessaracoccus caeni TaxID=3031239 RepID=UPI0023DABBE4|nr:hypothetical protein [Tessaracoccus caeni]MDF1488172.1 hypothetical protein [Tessaracoccus caeni]